MEKNILIVDDDEDLSFIIVEMLEGHGFSATSAQTLEDAFALLAKNKFHLILLDINLPDGTGFELCGELRRVSTVPVIFASARTSESDRVSGLDMGGDDYLPKPYSLRELLSRVNAVMRRAYGFDLLAYLCEHPNTALSKEKLLGGVWGAFSELEPSTLTVHIRWLREKLEDDPAAPV